MSLNSAFSALFKLAGPVIVAPMAGGPTTPALVTAVCEAGALGSLAGAYLDPQQLQTDIRKIKTTTQRPFAVNLFAPNPDPHISAAQMQSALAATRKYRDELRIQEAVVTPPFHHNFDEQFAVLLSEKPAVFSFVFGLVSREHIQECSKRGIYTIGTATSLQEAHLLRDLHVNAVVAQGVEAGGHRGIFSPDADDAQLGTMALAESISKSLPLPVSVSGGIMHGSDIQQALKHGAHAVQMGTAFLLCDEAGTSEAYRKALLAGGMTRTTRVFSGRPARGLENRFMHEMEETKATILPFSAQNALTRDIRAAAARQGKAEFLSLWAGTGVKHIRQWPAATLVQKLFQQLHDCQAA